MIRKKTQSYACSHLPYSSPSFSLVPCWSQQMSVFYLVLASNSATSSCTCDSHKVEKSICKKWVNVQIIYSTQVQPHPEGHNLHLFFLVMFSVKHSPELMTDIHKNGLLFSWAFMSWNDDALCCPCRTAVWGFIISQRTTSCRQHARSLSDFLFFF